MSEGEASSSVSLEACDLAVEMAELSFWLRWTFLPVSLVPFCCPSYCSGVIEVSELSPSSPSFHAPAERKQKSLLSKMGLNNSFSV